MARVELTHNKGPEVITSHEGSVSGSTNYGPIVNVRNYTLHSYQVINSGTGSLTFKIIGSNFTDPSTNTAASLPANSAQWTTISTHTVGAGNSLAYSDVWNFKFSSILLGGNCTDIKVYEKHNA